MMRHFPTVSIERGQGTSLAATLALASMLMWPAVLNGFPLIFPDSGAYFGIIYGRDYAIDRSSVYGLLLKPIVSTLPSLAGLWLGIFVQCLVVATLIVAVTRRTLPNVSLGRSLPFFAALTLATSVAWHTGQYMPDAFTGALVLVAWLAASRDPADDYAPTFWLAATILALVHYTHIPLLAVVAVVTIICSPAPSNWVRSAARRSAAAIVSVGVAAAILIIANGAVLGRWSMTPMAPAFLFARLTEDGLSKPWLREACGTSAPRKLCDIRDEIPDDSQVLLWRADSPYHARLWYPSSDSERWAWVDMLSAANAGAIAARPAAFLQNSLRGGFGQFSSFQAMDDECPRSCRGLNSGPIHGLNAHRPDAAAALRTSRQVTGTSPRALVRAVTTPVATISLLLLPVLLGWALRRRDTVVVSLVAAIAAALITNAMLAGALSDVHDRYQSRIVWLVPFAVVLALIRWRQTFSRSRISLPGLK